jgi:predicted RNA-binding Zn-ribbon protein involved in translation (DUF1610 family)
MTQIGTTVDVDADVYRHALPDDYSDGSVTLEVKAFSDKLYLKFPRQDRSGMDEYCMHADSIFKALVQVTDRAELQVSACVKKLGIVDKIESNSSYVDDDDVTTVHPVTSELDQVQLEVVEYVATTIADVQDDDYWRGYHTASQVHSDERIDWTDTAWTCFFDRLDDCAELLVDVGKWLAHNGYAVCNRSNAVFRAPEWSRPTGSYVASISNVFGGQCPNCGADKSEHWTKTSASNRSRVPDTYKCDACGHNASGITTG